MAHQGTRTSERVMFYRLAYSSILCEGTKVNLQTWSLKNTLYECMKDRARITSGHYHGLLYVLGKCHDRAGHGLPETCKCLVRCAGIL